MMEQVISDPAVLLGYENTTLGRLHRAWASRQKVNRSALRRVSCFVQEYSIKDNLPRNWMRLSDWDYKKCISRVGSLQCVVLKHL